jgi:hypothetical protein
MEFGSHAGFRSQWVNTRVGSSPTGRTEPGFEGPVRLLAGRAFGVSQPNSSRTTGTNPRNAFPRWLIAFFSSGVSSAQVRVSPSGWRIGS